MPTLTREGDVFVLNLGETDPRFNLETVTEIGSALDEVQAAGSVALVTSAAGKVWHNGMDLEWMQANPEHAGAVVDGMQVLFARFLGLGVPTVAAIGGHVFAGGALFALVHDVRIMRADRGWFCLPEVDLGMPFTPGLAAVLEQKLTRRTAHEAATTGRRYTGPEAEAAWIVDALAEQDAVLPRAVERAAAMAGKQPAALATIKVNLHGAAIAALRQPSGFGT